MPILTNIRKRAVWQGKPYQTALSSYVSRGAKMGGGGDMSTLIFSLWEGWVERRGRVWDVGWGGTINHMHLHDHIIKIV